MIINTSVGKTIDVQLTQDAATNRLILQNAFDTAEEYSIVRLVSGKYPIPYSIYTKNQYNQDVIVTPRPTIRKTGVVFDLNGSCLYGVPNGSDVHGKKSIICIAGKDITVKNGELVGTFNSPREKGSNGQEVNFYEEESVLSLEELNYTNATIENMTLRNARGYALTGSNGLYQDESLNTSFQLNSYYYTGGAEGTTQMIRNYYQSNAQKGYLADEYSTTSITIPSGYKYIMCGNARLGTAFRISSSFPAIYEFTIGSTKQYIHETPNQPVLIPDGATSVIVTVGFCGTDKPYTDGAIPTNRRLGVMFLQHGLGVTVNNCFFHNNSSLGCAAGLGVWSFNDCRSAYNSFYRDAIEGYEGSTVGMLDVEEFPCALVTLNNCRSIGDQKLAMIDAYKTVITGCASDRRGAANQHKQIVLGSIYIVGGWEANIDNCHCPIYTNKETLCNISNCFIGYTVEDTPYDRTNWQNCVFENLDWARQPQTYDSVITYKEQSSLLTPANAGIIRGISSACMHIMNNSCIIPNATFDLPNKGKYTELKIRANNYKGLGSNYAINTYYLTQILTNTAGATTTKLDSDIIVFPNGGVVSDSLFVSGVRNCAYSLSSNKEKGKFLRCTFKAADTDLFIIVKASVNPFELTFEDCDFIATNKKLFTKGSVAVRSQTFSADCKLTFTNCTINGTKLTDASQLTSYMDSDSQAVITIA